MTQTEREDLQTIVVAIEADAMALGFETRQFAHRQADRIRAFLSHESERDTLPAPAPTSSYPPAATLYVRAK